MLREIGNIITWVSIIILVSGYVWSFIIAWRKNKWLFVLVLFFWILGYPILLAKYWKETKNNFFVILAGIACFILAFIILAATNPNRTNTTTIERYSGRTQQSLQLTSQYAAPLRSALYCRSTELKRYIAKNKNSYCCFSLH